MNPVQKIFEANNKADRLADELAAVRKILGPLWNNPGKPVSECVRDLFRNNTVACLRMDEAVKARADLRAKTEHALGLAKEALGWMQDGETEEALGWLQDFVSYLSDTLDPK